jgi:sugar lactone lactonase YvrE
VNTTRNILRYLFFTAACIVWATPVVRAQTWQDISANVPGQLTEEQYLVAASDGTRLYVLGRQGVFMSADNGNSFTAINDVAGGLPSLGLASFRFIKFVNGEIWLGGMSFSDIGEPPGPRLFRLIPSETVWQARSGGIPGSLDEAIPEDITHDPVTGNYYVTMAGVGFSTVGPVYVSSDGGNTWQLRTNGLGGIGSPSSIISINGSLITSRPLGDIYRSTNGGASWSQALTSTQDGVGPMIRVQDRALLWRGVNADFSDDGGLTWNRVRPLASVFSSNAILSADGNLVFACTRGGLAPGTLAYSASGGLGWHVLPTTGLPPIPTPAAPSAGNYMPNYLMRHGDFLFVTGVSRDSSFLYEAGFLHRLDVLSFAFENPFSIVIQPQPKGLLVGQSHKLEVYATGPDISYQWQKNSEDIPGKTGRVLELNNAQTSDSGSYRVTVTSAGTSSLTSNAVTVTVFQKQDGRWDPGFDQTNLTGGGRVHLRPNNEHLVVRTDSTSFTITRMGPDGGRLTSVSSNTASGNTLSNSLLDQNGQIVAAQKISSNNNAIWRYNADTLAFISSTFFGPTTSSLRFSDIVEVPGKGYAVAGSISTVTPAGSGAVTLKDFALIKYDGTVDATFAPGAGPDSTTQFVTYSALNGNTYVSGSGFSTWSGIPMVRGIARIDSTGAIHALPVSGVPGTTRCGYIHALADGRLLTLFGTSGARVLYALNPDGSRDATFNTAGHTIADIKRVVQQTDGKIIIVGNFTAFGGVTAAGYIRLNLDGTVDNTFYTAAGFSHGTINDVTYDPRGYIYLSTTTNSTTFQGQTIPTGRGPVRIFATPADPGGGGGFSAWPALLALPEDQRGPLATPAGDKVPNLVKYAIGIGPLDSAAGRIPQEVIEGDGVNEGYPVVSFVRVKDLVGITMGVEVSTGLDFATDLGSTAISVEDLGDGTERVSVRSNARFSDHARQFFRLDVTLD